MKKDILGHPEAVIFHYDRGMFEGMIEQWAEDKFGESISINLELDSEYIDLFDVYLDEDDNSETVLEKLANEGYSNDDATELKNKILDQLLPKGWSAFTSLLDGDEFSVKVHIPYHIFVELQESGEI